MKALRGTPFDLPGRAYERKVERALVRHYRVVMERALSTLTPASYDSVAALADLPDMVRGYGEVKLANVALYKTEVERALRQVGISAPFGAVLDGVRHEPAPRIAPAKAA